MQSVFLDKVERVMNKSYIESSLVVEDEVFEVPLRPQHLRDFIGQQAIRERLEIEKKKGTPESWIECLWLDGQIFAIENLIMERNE